MYVFLLTEKIEINIYLEQSFSLLTKTWKYVGSEFYTEVAGGAQTLRRHYDFQKFTTDAILFREIKCKKSDISMF